MTGRDATHIEQLIPAEGWWVVGYDEMTGAVFLDERVVAFALVDRGIESGYMIDMQLVMWTNEEEFTLSSPAEFRANNHHSVLGLVHERDWERRRAGYKTEADRRIQARDAEWALRANVTDGEPGQIQ